MMPVMIMKLLCYLIKRFVMGQTMLFFEFSSFLLKFFNEAGGGKIRMFMLVNPLISRFSLPTGENFLFG
jgi:hypothetical protein